MGIVRGFQEGGKKGVFPHSILIFIIMSQTIAMDKEEQSCVPTGKIPNCHSTYMGRVQERLQLKRVRSWC